MDRLRTNPRSAGRKPVGFESPSRYGGSPRQAWIPDKGFIVAVPALRRFVGISWHGPPESRYRGTHMCRCGGVELGVTAQAGRVSGRCPGALSIAGEDTYRCESIGYEVDG